MLRDEDEFDEPDYRCPVCRRSFSSFASLDDHMVQHRGPRQCSKCGKLLRENEYHDC